MTTAKSPGSHDGGCTGEGWTICAAWGSGGGGASGSDTASADSAALGRGRRGKRGEKVGWKESLWEWEWEREREQKVRLEGWENGAFGLWEMVQWVAKEVQIVERVAAAEAIVERGGFLPRTHPIQRCLSILSIPIRFLFTRTENN